jgi:hypothetical protein
MPLSETKDIHVPEHIRILKEAHRLKASLNKQADTEELKQATFVVMSPDEVDLHGDITSEDEVRDACHSYNIHCRKSNLFHLTETETFAVVESYICPTDFTLEDRFIKKGTWLCTVQVNDDNLWLLIKSGYIKSVSIGAVAAVEEL